MHNFRAEVRVRVRVRVSVRVRVRVRVREGGTFYDSALHFL